MKTISSSHLTAIILSGLLGVTACGPDKEKSPGEKAEDAVEEAGDSVEEGAEEVGDEIDDATDDK